MKRFMGIVLAVLLVTLQGPAFAHGMRTAYLEVVEAELGHATVHLRLTSPDEDLFPEPPPGCSLTAAGDAHSSFDRAWLLDCPGGIPGHVLAIHGIGPVVSEVVVWTSFVDGTTASHIVKQDDARFELRRDASGWSVVVQYVRLGVIHILTGYDHLLFLMLLVLLLRKPRSRLCRGYPQRVLAPRANGRVLREPRVRRAVPVVPRRLGEDVRVKGGDRTVDLEAISRRFPHRLIFIVGRTKSSEVQRRLSARDRLARRAVRV